MRFLSLTFSFLLTASSAAQTLPGVIVSGPPGAPPPPSQFAAEAPGTLIVSPSGGGTLTPPDPPFPPLTRGGVRGGGGERAGVAGNSPRTGGMQEPAGEPSFSPPPFYQQHPMGPESVRPVAPPAPPPAELKFDWMPSDNLFNYSWLDFGSGHGLRIHRLEWTNGWTDLRAPDFFTRPTSQDQHFHAGLSFAVQWWKERPRPDFWPFGASLPPSVLYDLYLDLDWRSEVAPGLVIDLAYSPGLSTDFRVTPPDGFRSRAHAIAMIDMLPNLRGVLGVWYLNRNTTKLLPVAGLVWQLNDWTRVEAVFPQPRLVRQLGCWRDRTWEWRIGGEFGGGGWAFKNPEGDRETIDYRDSRLVTGITWSGKRGEGWLEVGYVFNRELQYGRHQGFDYDPGNSIMARIGWAY